jgi:RNA polymerase sigma factor (sigma-70 family)
VSRFDALRKDSALTPERFALLLAALDHNPSRAADCYEQLRRALVAFFEYRDLRDPEAAADETFDRAARRLSEGQQITAANPADYFYGIARFVWRERLAAHRQAVPLSDLEPHTHVTPHTLLEERESHAAQEKRLARLRTCMESLPEAERELVLAYYHGAGQLKIQQRRMLAQQLGVPLSTLRLRMFRLREKLEGCVKRGMRKK